MQWWLIGGKCLLLLLLTARLALAQEQYQVLEEILVETERVVEKQNRITIRPEGLPAQVNIITPDEVQRTPYTGDVLDVLRKVPGLNIQKYPRGDMGHQIGLRGFIGNNGVAIVIDGVPMNTIHWYHGQMEIGWLIPEMIDRIEVIKGPFSALYGDFALGGVINIVTKNADPGASLGAYGGSFGTGRAVGVFSQPDWKINPFLVWEGYTRDGYRINSDYHRGQFFNKFTFSGRGRRSLPAAALFSPLLGGCRLPAGGSAQGRHRSAHLGCQHHRRRQRGKCQPGAELSSQRRRGGLTS